MDTIILHHRTLVRYYDSNRSLLLIARLVLSINSCAIDKTDIRVAKEKNGPFAKLAKLTTTLAEIQYTRYANPTETHGYHNVESRLYANTTRNGTHLNVQAGIHMCYLWMRQNGSLNVAICGYRRLKLKFYDIGRVSQGK